MTKPITQMTRAELIDALTKERAYSLVLETSIELEVQERLDNEVRDDIKSAYDYAERRGYLQGLHEGGIEGYRKGRVHGYEYGFNDCIDQRYRGDKIPVYQTIDKRRVDARSKQAPYHDTREAWKNRRFRKSIARRLDGRE